jgi:chloramphenicol 3-O phosphotransferase
MSDTTPGTIIVLNGCMSAGKSSIAKAIQRTFDVPYLLVGMDLFWLQVFPWEWAGAAANSVYDIPIEGTSPPQIAQLTRPFGRLFVSGLHQTIATLARMGHNVVVDEVFYEASYVTEILTLWESLPVWLVGVTCPLETVHERAAARADRSWPSYLPTATWMFDEAHKHTRGIYDLTVDTSRLTPTECALQIKHVLDERGSPSALKHLAAHGTL